MANVIPGTVYLVGGAVRDQLLGINGGDRDYVVVGASPEAMRQAGFRPVGRDFPVFIGPHDGCEYALARTERKRGRGHQGFEFHAAPEVTLEADLARRDLTINAIAQAADGSLVDPHGGLRDLAARVLRHVSPAFAEDPLRVLRVARFAARFAPLGFALAPETHALMRSMSRSGELTELSAERVYAELHKALQTPRPGMFIRVLHQAGGLAAWLAEIEALYNRPGAAAESGSSDAGTQLERSVDRAAALAPGDALIGYATLLHDLALGGEAATASGDAPAVLLADQVSVRLKAPAEFAALARSSARWQRHVAGIFSLRAAAILGLLEGLDALRKPERVAQLGRVVQAVAQAPDDAGPYPPALFLDECLAAIRQVHAAPLRAAGLEGPELGVAMRQARLEALAHLLELQNKG